MTKIVCILFSMISLIYACVCEDRTVIGQGAYVSVVEADLEYLARIDTGARISSLHAINISIKGNKSLIYTKNKPLKGNPVFERVENEEYRHDIGSIVDFDTLNEKGDSRHIRAHVIRVSKVNNAQGSEYRYVIRLGVKYKDILKYKEVNLRDRSDMKYKLLIGRNWLSNDFLIDADEK